MSEEYIKITRAVGDKVLNVLSNAKVLLGYALSSITESIRNDPERYKLIFYNMSSEEQHLSQDYNTEVNMAIIVNDAKKLFNKLVKDGINKVITYCTFSCCRG
jgi:hypothetical protein